MYLFTINVGFIEKKLKYIFYFPCEGQTLDYKSDVYEQR